MLDAGQCNDSYSLAVIALKLKEVFGLEDINDLPIVYNIAWYEQKAVIVLLALLHLGVKNIHLGPTLPAFLSPNVAKVLVENFGIAGIGTVEEDLALFFGESSAAKARDKPSAPWRPPFVLRLKPVDVGISSDISAALRVLHNRSSSYKFPFCSGISRTRIDKVNKNLI